MHFRDPQGDFVEGSELGPIVAAALRSSVVRRAPISHRRTRSSDRPCAWGRVAVVVVDAADKWARRLSPCWTHPPDTHRHGPRPSRAHAGPVGCDGRLVAHRLQLAASEQTAAAAAAGRRREPAQVRVPGNMSHELRTPLNRDHSFSSFLSEQLGSDNEQMPEALPGECSATPRPPPRPHQRRPRPSKVEAGRIELRPEGSSSGHFSRRACRNAGGSARFRRAVHDDSEEDLEPSTSARARCASSLQSPLEPVKFTPPRSVALTVTIAAARSMWSSRRPGLGIHSRAEQVFGESSRFQQGLSLRARHRPWPALTNASVRAAYGRSTSQWRERGIESSTWATDVLVNAPRATMLVVEDESPTPT